MKISLLPAIVGVTVMTGAPAYAACLSDITKFQDSMEASWQSANYETPNEQEREETGPAQQRQEAADQAGDQSLEGRTSEARPRTTEDARKEDEKNQAKAESEAVQETTEEVVGSGKTITEHGGTTTYAAGGPAQPTENWFGKPPRRAEILAKLEEAREYADAGDETACNEALGAAQKLAGEEG